MRRLLLLLAMTPLTLHAQNQLVPADDAVQLRRVWTQKGADLSADEYGYNVWGGTDITGDSIADFAVHRRSDNTWLFYGGGTSPDTIPFLEVDSVGSVPPYVAHYFGDDRRYALFRSGYRVDIEDYSYFYDILSLRELSDNTIAQQPSLSVDQGSKDPPIERFINQVLVSDIDNDGIEDVIVLMNGLRVGQDRFGADLTRQVWIYKGGPDFTLDTPPVIIKDTGVAGAPDNWQVRFADLDGDGRTDMVMGGDYPGVGDMLRFYFGDDGSPASWATRDPDRDLPLVSGQTGMRAYSNFGLFRLDAHPGLDIVGYTGNEAAGTHVYLSSRGNPRDRSFLAVDADIVYANEGFTPIGVGSMNDSLGRYDMLPMSETRPGNQIARALVSGAADGPDHDYEAWYAPGLDGLQNTYATFQRGAAVGDVTGDGFDDVLYADYTDGPFVNTGVAFLLAGGPYIPFDDPSTVVEEYPVAGESSGLYLWPNPVDDELHIAWRGNLKSMPSRFEIYDMNGEMVVEGEVEPYRGAAVWRCADVAAGGYVLCMYDETDQLLSTAEVRKL